MDKEFIKNPVEAYEKLKQENEELRAKQIKSLGFICDCEENVKYKQALEEIRDLKVSQGIKDDVLKMINEVLKEE